MIRYFLSIIALMGAINVLADDATNSPPAAPVSPSLARDPRFFEMRTYHAAPGKLEALHARFRNFTNKLFVKHGMDVVGCWAPMNKDGQYDNALVYILAFPSRKAREKDWKEFTDDIEWAAVKADTEKNGRLVEKVDSVFMTATDYSPIK
jgi:hypothetical protein